MVGIFVVSETRLYREGLSRALADEESFEIVGTAADLASAIALIARLCPLPDVVAARRRAAVSGQARRP